MAVLAAAATVSRSPKLLLSLSFNKRDRDGIASFALSERPGNDMVDLCVVQQRNKYRDSSWVLEIAQ
jgi:hypothetical protein